MIDPSVQDLKDKCTARFEDVNLELSRFKSKLTKVRDDCQYEVWDGYNIIEEEANWGDKNYIGLWVELAFKVGALEVLEQIIDLVDKL